MTDPLATAVDATLARMAALREAKDQLDRRNAALREYHDGGRAVQEVVMDLYDALRAKGVSRDDLRESGAGVSYASVEKVLRKAK